MRTVCFFLLTACIAADCEASPVGKDWTADLHQAIEGATRLRVRSGGTCHRQPNEEKILLDVRDAKEVVELIRQIRIDANQSGFQLHVLRESDIGVLPLRHLDPIARVPSWAEFTLA